MTDSFARRQPADKHPPDSPRLEFENARARVNWKHDFCLEVVFKSSTVDFGGTFFCNAFSRSPNVQCQFTINCGATKSRRFVHHLEAVEDKYHGERFSA